MQYAHKVAATGSSDAHTYKYSVDVLDVNSLTLDEAEHQFKVGRKWHVKTETPIAFIA